MCSLQERTNGIRANRFKNECVLENEIEVLNALISKWKYLYEIQFSYTDWTFAPKALRQDQVRERAGKIKILRGGTNVNEGWLRAPGTVVSFHILPCKCFIYSFAFSCQEHPIRNLP